MFTPKLPLTFVKGFAVLAMALFIASCSEESKLASHIPKDANAVVAFDVKSMALKSMDFKEILNPSNLKKIFSGVNENDSVSNMIAESGIDMLNKAYIFAKAESTEKGYGCAIAALNDPKKFETFVKKLNKDATITEEGGFKIATLEEKITVGWNQTEVLFLFGGENAKETILTLGTLTKDESLTASSEHFASLEKAAADISVFVNFESLGKIIPQTGATATVDLKETFMTATCNFEDGQIVVDTKYISNEELARKMNMTKSNIGETTISALPGQSVIGLFGIALDMEKMYSYLEAEGGTAAYDAQSTQFTGLSLKELVGTFSGDIAGTINGISMKDEEAYDWATGQVVTKKSPSPDYCVVLGISNNDNAAKLFTTLAGAGMLTQKDNYYTFQNKMFVSQDGGVMKITGTESLLQAGDKLDAKLTDLLKSNTGSMYVNLNNIPDSFYEGSNATAGEYIKGMELEDIIITSAPVQGTTTTGKMVVNFKQKGENSLITLGRVSKKFNELMSAPPVPVQDPVVAATLE